MRQDFTIAADRHYSLETTLTEPDGTTKLNLTGCTLSWGMSKAPGQEVLITKTSAAPSEIVITSAADGEATIFIVPGDTEDFGGAPYEHEMKLVDGDSAESTVFRGLITITKSVIT